MSSDELSPALFSVLSNRIKDIRKARWEPLSGGSINEVFKVSKDSSVHVIKLNRSAGGSSILASEQEGLDALKEHLPVPRMDDFASDDKMAMVCMDYYPYASCTLQQWRDAGIALANMHNQVCKHFGWIGDNYIGSLVQENAPCKDAASFLITRRFQPLLRMARSKSLVSPALVSEFNRVFKAIEKLFQHEDACLVHGDLWAGNVLETSTGVLFIDPAVHWGTPSNDLAMSKLFGRFPSSFYEGYHSIIPVQENQEDKETLASLIPLLVHLNLFGTAYLPQLREAMKKVLA